MSVVRPYFDEIPVKVLKRVYDMKQDGNAGAYYKLAGEFFVLGEDCEVGTQSQCRNFGTYSVCPLLKGSLICLTPYTCGYPRIQGPDRERNIGFSQQNASSIIRGFLPKSRARDVGVGRGL